MRETYTTIVLRERIWIDSDSLGVITVPTNRLKPNGGQGITVDLADVREFYNDIPQGEEWLVFVPFSNIKNCITKGGKPLEQPPMYKRPDVKRPDEPYCYGAGIVNDWAPLPENVAMHTMMNFHQHDDGRGCGYHSRLGKWTFDDDKECLRSHDD